MQKYLFALSLGFLGTILACQAAQSQQANCANRDQVLQRLQQHFGETRQSVGLAANNGMVETYANADSGTWTILITLPSGMTCLIASGEAYETFKETEMPPDGKA